MKEKILNFLKSDRSFQEGLNIYLKHGQNVAVKQILNRQGESDYNHNFLLEELRKLGGLAVDEFKHILSIPVAIATEAIQEVIQEVKDELNIPVTSKEKKVFLKELPSEIKNFIRIRDEFPFLNDSDCPNELKILVADRITAYHKYVEAHQRLFTAVSDKELMKAVSGVVENYIDNQEIWDELKHYKETGTLLGKHKIFSTLDRMAEIKAMPVPELVKLKKNLENNIARNRQKVTEQPEHPETGARSMRIEEYLGELNEVNKLLGINA